MRARGRTPAGRDRRRGSHLFLLFLALVVLETLIGLGFIAVAGEPGLVTSAWAWRSRVATAVALACSLFPLLANCLGFFTKKGRNTGRGV